MNATLINCDDCAHCVDLGYPKDDDPAQVTAARTKVKTQIATWIAETPYPTSSKSFSKEQFLQ